MNKKTIFQEIEKILDNWDPIGILQNIKPLIYIEGAIGEYTQYVEPIVEAYLSNQSIYNYLVQLYSELRDDPDEEVKNEIKLVSEQITALFES